MDVLSRLLSGLGYDHPLHPPLTHLTLGLVMAAFIFGLLARLQRRSPLATTSWHCTVLALVAAVPTVLLGYLDWHARMGGAWILPIKVKIVAAGVLIFLLLVAAMARPRLERLSARTFTFQGLSLLAAIVLGYFGGELVFGNLANQQSPVAARLYARHCGSCHPGGGNTIKTHLVLRDAPQLRNLPTFRQYLRQPKARDNSATVMPSFSPTQLSDSEVAVLYQYLRHQFRAP